MKIKFLDGSNREVDNKKLNSFDFYFLLIDK